MEIYIHRDHFGKMFELPFYSVSYTYDGPTNDGPTYDASYQSKLLEGQDSSGTVFDPTDISSEIRQS